MTLKHLEILHWIAVAVLVAIMFTANGCVTLERVFDSLAVVDPPEVVEPPEPKPEPKPEEPEPLSKSIAYIRDGRTLVNVGEKYDGQTATLSGSVDASTTVVGYRAWFDVKAAKGDVLTVGDMTLMIWVLR